MEKFTISKKFTGVKLAIVWFIISVAAGLNNLGINDPENINIRKAGIFFLYAIVVLIGIGLYTLRKKAKLGYEIRGGKFIEGFLLLIILAFFLLSILNGSWYQNPLVFSVTPTWILLAYFYLFFAKV